MRSLSASVHSINPSALAKLSVLSPRVFARALGWRKPLFTLALAAALASWLAAGTARAALAVDSWTGAVSTDWSNSLNWLETPGNLSVLPTSTTKVVLDLGTGNLAIIASTGFSTGSLFVGNTTAGAANALTIQSGGNLTSNTTIIGNGFESSGVIVVTDTASSWNVTNGAVIVGANGTGNLSIANGASAEIASNDTMGVALYVGGAGNGTGTVLISDVDSSLNRSSLFVDTGAIVVGAGASGNLTVANGGQIIASGADSNGVAVYIGAGSNSSTFTVTGRGGPFNFSSKMDDYGGAMVVGSTSNGTLSVTDSGTVNVLGIDGSGVGLYLGQNSGTVGQVTVTDSLNATTRSTLNVSNGPAYIGLDGTGNLAILGGGKGSFTGSDGSSSVYFGYDANSTGNATISTGLDTGTQSLLTAVKGVEIGFSGNSTVTVANGGTMVAASSSADVFGFGLVLGDQAGSNGNLVVHDFVGGNVSTVTVSHGAGVVGLDGTGNLSISNDGVVNFNGTDSGNVGLYAGYGANSTGTITVGGANLNVQNGALIIGFNGTGNLDIQNSASVTARGHDSGNISVYIGYNEGSNGSVIVDDGAGFLGVDGGALVVGYNGNGTMTVDAGATTDNESPDGNGFSAYVAYGANSTGTVNITDSGSQWFIDGGVLAVGYSGNGSLTVSNGGSMTTNGISIANQENSTGSITVQDANSAINSDSGALVVGNGGNGNLTVANGGNVTLSGNDESGVSGYIGAGANATGVVNVTDPHSTLNLGADLQIGVNGNGTLNITNGGNVGAYNTTVAENANSTGNLSLTNGGVLHGNLIDIGGRGQATVTVDGANSTLTMGGGGTDVIGDADGSNGTVTVSNGGYFFSNGSLTVGSNENSTGNVAVTDSGSNLTATNNLTIGDSGAGNLSILNGGAVHAFSSTIGASENGTGTATVSDNGSVLSIGSGGLIVGDFGNGTLTVQNGGNVTLDGYLAIGNDLGGNGTVLVTDANSTLGSIDLYVGYDGSANLTVANGGNVTADGSIYVAWGSDGCITVTGANSTLGTGGTFYVGYDGAFNGSLTVSNGGNVAPSSLIVGYNGSTNGTVTISDANSTLNVDDDLIVGDSGTGSLTVSNGGNVTVGSFVALGDDDGGNGTILVTDANSTLSATGDIYVGDTSFGNLTVANGGNVTTSASFYIGDDGDGSVYVMDANSTLGVSDALVVGTESATGNLTVSNGGTVTAASLEVGSESDATGVALVTDANSTLHITDDAVQVGNYGTGTLTLDNGGNLAIDSTNSYNNALVLGNNTDSSGTFIVNGANTSFSLETGNIVVGLHGYGNLAVTNGGTVVLNGDFLPLIDPPSTVFVGKRSDGSGDIFVSGVNSTLTIDATGLNLGSRGTGNLTVQCGGLIDLSNSYIVAGDHGGTGNIVLSNGGTLKIGANGDGVAIYAVTQNLGTGYLTFNGGTLEATADSSNIFGMNLVFEDETSSTILLNGTNLTITSNSDGNGDLVLAGGGNLAFANFEGDLGNLTVANGTLTVDGDTDGYLQVNGTATMGNADGDNGTLQVVNGGEIDVENYADLGPSLVIGNSANSTGQLVVGNDANFYVHANSTVVGNAGAGNLTVTDFGYLELDGSDSNVYSLVISNAANGSGTVLITNSGGLYTAGGVLVGAGNIGNFTVANGGTAELNGDSDADTALRVDNNSTVTLSDDTAAGSYITTDYGTVDLANGSLNITGGNFTIQDGQLLVATADNATISVSGGNLVIDDTNDPTHLGVAENVTGTLEVSGGNVMSSADFYVGDNANGTGVVNVTTGNFIETGGDFIVGQHGNGTLNISGGIFSSDSDVILAPNDDSNGAINLTGGVLATTGIDRAESNGTALLTLNGGTLRANDNNDNFLSGFAGAEIVFGDNGVTVDTNCYDIAFQAGFSGNGTLVKTGHGDLALDDTFTLGGLEIKKGSVTVDDESLYVNGDISVADHWHSSGTLNVQDEGYANATNLTIGDGRHANGTVNVNDGELDVLYASIGGQGNGTLAITHGSVYASGNIEGVTMVLGAQSCSNGTVTVAEGSSLYVSDGALIVGNSGTGNLTVSNGGYLETSGVDSTGSAAYIGGHNGNSGTGDVTVTGTESEWLVNGGQLVIDDGGEGYLSVENGGTVIVSGHSEGLAALSVGQNERTRANIFITDSGSSMTVNGGVAIVGNGGEASVFVANGGTLTFSGLGSGNDSLLLASGSDATLDLADTNSTMHVENGGTVMGYFGNATVSITNGAAAYLNGTDTDGNSLLVGYVANTSSTITVQDVDSMSLASSLQVNNGTAIIGVNGAGTLNVTNGGHVEFDGVDANGVSLVLGAQAGSNGTINVGDVEPVSGYSSQVVVENATIIGDGGNGTLNISNGGLTEIENADDNGVSLYIGYGVDGDGHVTVTGINLCSNLASTLELDNGIMMVGYNGSGHFTLANGGKLIYENGQSDGNGVAIYAGYNAGASGSIHVEDVDANGNQTTLTVDSGALVIGANGSGRLVVTNGGKVVVSGTDSVNGFGLYAGENSNSTGNIIVAGLDTDSGLSSTLRISGSPTMIGFDGNGSLGVYNGGVVNSTGIDGSHVGAYLGFNSDGYGSAHVAGVNNYGDPVRSTWTVNRGLSVGASGGGELTVSNGGFVNVGVSGSDINQVGLYIGQNANSTGCVTVRDVETDSNITSALQISNGSLVVGYDGNGTLTIANAGFVEVNDHDAAGLGLILGFDANSTGTLTLADVERCTGIQSYLLLDNSALVVGLGGNGTMNITNGGEASVGTAGLGVIIADNEGSLGNLTVTGVNHHSGHQSTIDVHDGALVVGNLGTGAMTIANGGYVEVEGATNDSNNNAVLIGTEAGSIGTLTIDGIEFCTSDQSELYVVNGALIVGYNGTGTLNITNGGNATIDGNNANYYGMEIGSLAGSIGTVNVDGSDAANTGNASTLTVTAASLVVGNLGTGTLNITNGGYVLVNPGVDGPAFIVAGDTNSTGNVTVDGKDSNNNHSTLEVDSMVVGSGGNGTLTVSNGGYANIDGRDISDVSLYIGSGLDSTGAVTIDGSCSNLTVSSGAVLVGYNGTGTLIVSNGAQVLFDGCHSFNGLTLDVGVESNGNGTITVDGSGSFLSVTSGNGVYVGDTGTGTMNITNGGMVSVSTLDVGASACSHGYLLVSDANSTLNVTDGALIIGDAGRGHLTVANGGNVTVSDNLVLGNASGGSGIAHVTDANSTLTANDFYIGDSGYGRLEIENGGAVTANGSLYIADDSNGSVSVEDANSTLNVSGATYVGTEGSVYGHLKITNGGNVSLTGSADNGATLSVGRSSDSTGKVYVADEGSQLYVGNGAARIGDYGTGNLTIANGGYMEIYDNDDRQAGLYVGRHDESNGTVLVTDDGSQLYVDSGAVRVGDYGTGNLTIANGGFANITGSDGSEIALYLGKHASGNGVATVTGFGSELDVTDGAVIIGDSGTGNFTVSDHAFVNFSSSDGAVGVYVGYNECANGTLYIDGGTGRSPGLQPLFLASSEVDITDGALYVGFSGAGNVSVVNGGVLYLEGTDGNTVGLDLGRNENGTGTVLVSDNQSSLTMVDGAARVGDYGMGNLTVANGGEVDLQGSDDRGVGLFVGRHESGNGSVAVSDAASKLSVSDGAVRVGDYGNGSISISNGGSMVINGQDDNNISLYLGHHESGNGTITVSDAGSTLTVGSEDVVGAVIIGDSGLGALNITNGGNVTLNTYDNDETSLVIGANGGNGTVLVSDAGSSLKLTSETYAIVIGGNGTGALTVANGGSFQNSGWDDDGVAIYVGQGSGGTGNLTVTDAGSNLQLGNGAMVVGDSGNGTFSILSGATVSINAFYGPGNALLIANGGDSVSSVTVDGNGSTLTLGPAVGNVTVVPFLDGNSGLIIGGDGNGTLTITNGGLVTVHDVVVLGNDGDSTGTLNITNGGTLEVGGENGLTFGDGEYSVKLDGGTIRVIDEDLTTAVDISLGSCFSLPNIIDTNCFDATFSGILSGSGSLEKLGYGTLTLAANETYTGGTQVLKGTLKVDGSLGGNIGNETQSSGDLYVGGHSTELDITNGATVYVDDATFSSHRRNSATVLVSDAGSALYVNGTMTVGESGCANVTVANGGLVIAADAVLGVNCRADGYLTVTDVCSALNITTGNLLAGDSGYGNLVIANGGNVSVNSSLVIAHGDSGSGDVLLTDNGSQLNVNGSILVGVNGSATLTIANGATLTPAHALVISQSNGTGTVTVEDANSTLTLNNSTTIGEGGNGTLNIFNGGVVNQTGADGFGAAAYVANATNTTSSVTVDGEGSQWLLNGSLLLGNGGSGSLNITNGGNVTIAASDTSGIGLAAGISSGSSGNLTVDGADSMLNVLHGAVVIGSETGATLNVTNQGQVNVQSSEAYGVGTFLIGYLGNDTSSVTVDGYGSAIQVFNGSTVVGEHATGTLNITNGSLFASDAASPGYAAAIVGFSANGTVNVTGMDDEGCLVPLLDLSGWSIANGALVVGQGGNGTVNISSLGTVTISDSDGTNSLYLGLNANTTGNLSIDGEGASLAIGANGGSVVVGYNGNATVSITNGGLFADYGPSPALTIGSNVASVASVTVDGAGSTLDFTNGSISVANFGNGTLNVTNGGTANTSYIAVGTWGGANGSILVDGGNSSLVDSGGIDVGFHGNGSLTISNGGYMSANYVSAGTSGDAEGSGMVLVTGADSKLSVSGGVSVGGGSDSSLTIDDNGTVRVGDVISLGGSGTGTLQLFNGGTLKVGNTNGIKATGGYTFAMDGGRIQVICNDLTSSLNIAFTGNNGLNNIFDTHGYDATFSGVFTGNGTLEKDGNGTLQLTANQSYTGGTDVTGGELLVQGISISHPNGDLYVGEESPSEPANLTIVNGGSMDVGEAVFSNFAGSDDHVTVDNSTLKVEETLTVGNIGNATLTVSNGGNVTVLGADDTNGSVYIGNTDGAYGTVSITDNGSSFQVSNGAVVVGNLGNGNFTVTRHAVANLTGNDGDLIGLYLGTNGGNGTVTVDCNATLVIGAAAIVGYDNLGNLSVANGGSVEIQGAAGNGAGLTLGRDEESSGMVTIAGANTTFTVDNGSVRVGDYGYGNLSITNGANISLNGTQDNGAALLIGRHDSGNGTVLVTDANTTLNINNGAVRVGDYGLGSLSIFNGGVVNTNGSDENGIGLYVGKHADSNGTLDISDDLSALYMYSGTLAVGYDGNGTVTISNGGFLGAGADTDGGIVATIGTNAGSIGSVTVTDVEQISENASTFTVVHGALAVGYSGNGTLNIANGGLGNITDADENGIGLYIGYGNDSVGNVSVDGVESGTFQSSNLTLVNGALVVGFNGSATLEVTNGGVVDVQGADEAHGFGAYIGWHGSSTSSVSVRGEDSEFNVDHGALVVGNWGNGTLCVTNLGTAEIFNTDGTDIGLYIGRGDNGVGCVTIAGGTMETFGNFSAWVHSSLSVDHGAIAVGYDGAGNLTVSHGAAVFASGQDSAGVGLYVAANGNSSGTVMVSGHNSTLSIQAGALVVGGGGEGNLTVEHHGAMDALNVIVGSLDGGNGTLTVTDCNTTMTVNGSILVGDSGNGTLNIFNGALLTSNGTDGGNVSLLLGNQAAGIGSFELSDGSSHYNAYQGAIWVGNQGSGNLVIRNGAQFVSGGNDGSGAAMVLANEANATGNVSVLDSGSNLQLNAGDMVVGNLGNGTLTIDNGGEVDIADGYALALAMGAGSSGTVNLNDGTLQVGGPDAVRSGGGSAAFNLNGGTIRASSDFSTSVNFTLGNSTTSSINTNGNNGTVSGAVGGNGSLAKDGSGTLTLSGNNTYTGGTHVNNGNLVVDGSLASNVTLTASTAGLGGNGTIHGDVQVNAGGVSPGIANAVSGNAATGFATLTVTGNLAMNVSATTLAWHLNSAGPGDLADLLNVGGDLTGGTQPLTLITFDFEHTGFFGGVAGNYQTYTLINANNDLNDANLQFAAINAGQLPQQTTYSYFLFTNGGKTLEFVLVPEPAMWSLLLGGGAMLLAGLRRKRRC